MLLFIGLVELTALKKWTSFTFKSIHKNINNAHVFL